MKISFLYVQSPFQFIRARLAVTVTMKTFYTFRQSVRQHIGSHAENVYPAHTDYTVPPPLPNIPDLLLFPRIYPHRSFHLRIKTYELRKRIKGYMTAVFHKRRKILLCICRRISMRPASEFLESQSRFILRTRRGIIYILAEYRERLPHSKCLESQYYLHPGPSATLLIRLRFFLSKSSSIT